MKIHTKLTLLGIFIFVSSFIFMRTMDPLPSWTAPIIIPINFIGLLMIIGGILKFPIERN